MIKKIGIGILILGMVITVVTAVNMLTRDGVVDIADAEVTRDTSTYLVWTPLIGLAVILVGGGVTYYGIRVLDRETTRERR